MADPPVILGQGGQGDVVEATFRGTPVAVKRYSNMMSPRTNSGSKMVSLGGGSEKTPLETQGGNAAQVKRGTAAASPCMRASPR